jgi:hypothetical protein
VLCLFMSAWASFLLLSIAVTGFQNKQRNPSSQFQVPKRNPLPSTLNSISREELFRRSWTRLSASTQDQDASTSDHVNGDASSFVEFNTEPVRLVFDDVEIQRQQNDDASSEIVGTSWSYWSTGSQLVQAGAVGATTGLLVAIFKLVRQYEASTFSL